MKSILALLALAGTVGFLASCGDTEENVLGSTKPATGANGLVAFSSVLPIVQQNCKQCHSGYVDSGALAAVAKSAYGSVDDGSMPATGTLSAGQKATLLAWLDQESAVPAAPIVPITNTAGRVEFSSVLPITREKCAICHGSYTDSAKLSSSAASVQGAVESSYMPLPGPNPLTPVEKATLIAWLKQEQGL